MKVMLGALRVQQAQIPYVFISPCTKAGAGRFDQPLQQIFNYSQLGQDRRPRIKHKGQVVIIKGDSVFTGSLQRLLSVPDGLSGKPKPCLRLTGGRRDRNDAELLSERAQVIDSNIFVQSGSNVIKYEPSGCRHVLQDKFEVTGVVMGLNPLHPHPYVPRISALELPGPVQPRGVAEILVAVLPIWEPPTRFHVLLDLGTGCP